MCGPACGPWITSYQFMTTEDCQTMVKNAPVTVGHEPQCVPLSAPIARIGWANRSVAKD